MNQNLLNYGAKFSKCRKYRYTLWRTWNVKKPKVMFLGLNPSTADEINNDPTVTRCINYSKLWGYDVSPVSIKNEKKQINKTTFETNLDNIPKNYFDVIFIAVAFHHMSNQEQKETLLNCRNFLNENGCIYIFEHNPFNPLTRKIFNNCPLDKNAKMIYLKNIVSLAQMTGMKVVSKKYTLFFPKQLSFLKFVEKFISWIPIGAQYYIILKK